MKSYVHISLMSLSFQIRYIERFDEVFLRYRVLANDQSRQWKSHLTRGYSWVASEGSCYQVRKTYHFSLSTTNSLFCRTPKTLVRKERMYVPKLDTSTFDLKKRHLEMTQQLGSTSYSLVGYSYFFLLLCIVVIEIGKSLIQ